MKYSRLTCIEEFQVSGANILGGKYPGGNCPGATILGGNCPGGNCPGGNYPRTVFCIITVVYMLKDNTTLCNFENHIT